MSNVNDSERLLSEADDALKRCRGGHVALEPEQIASALLQRADALMKLGRREEALVGFDEFLESFGDGSFDEQATISAQFQKAMLLQAAGRFAESIHTFDLVLERATHDLPALPYVVIESLWGKATDLQRLGKADEANVVLESLVSSFSGDTRTTARRLVAQAMIAQAWLLERAGNPDEALSELGEIIRRFSSVDDSGIRHQVADARTRRGRILSELDRPKAALEEYENVIALEESISGPDFAHPSGNALYGKARELAELGRDQQALGTIDALLSRFSAGGSSARSEVLVVMAMHLRARLLTRAGAFEELAEVSHALMDLFARTQERRSRDLLRDAIAEVIAGLVLGRQWDDAVAACDSLIVGLSHSADASDRGLAGLALADKGLALSELGRAEEAEVIRTSALAFGDDALRALDERAGIAELRTQPSLGEEEARLLYSRALVLEGLGRNGEATTALSELISHLEASDAPNARRVVEAARQHRARLLGGAP